MKRKHKHTVVLWMTMALLSCGKQSKEIYVSPDGDDSANGKSSSPVAGLQRAATLAGEKAGEIPVTIFLSGGNYFLTEPLNLTAKEGGTSEAPVHWKAMPGEKPVISGGISVRNWKQEDDGSWSALLPAGFQGKFRSLYINGKRAIRARFPDNGYLRIEKAGEDNRTHFFFRKDDFPKINNVQGLELIFLHEWSVTRIRVKSIDWESNDLIAVDSIGARLPFFTITNWEAHPRYYLENAREFCNAPGEWYCDFEERKIYYHPLRGQKINETEGVIPVATKLITITGSREQHAGYISFEGITFENTSWQLPEKGYCGIQATMFDDRDDLYYIEARSKIPAAIELDFAENCGFFDCTIRHTGGSGIWIRENCKGCEILGSHIYDISGNGINIGEGLDRLVDGVPWWISVPYQVSVNNKISRSLIEDCGKQFYGAVGIWVGLAANTTIDHNEIRNLPYTGISVGWMWNPDPSPCRENTIDANDIHHIMNILSDGGGIYMLGLQPGSRITGNFIHDVKVNAGRTESNGMFLDEGTKELLIEKNIIYNIARSPLRFHRGYYPNTVANNVLVCGKDTPPIRYNNTKEEDIVKTDNIILDSSSETDMKKLHKIIEKRIMDVGPASHRTALENRSVEKQ